ncbi:MAG TPA: hypothetical protein PKD09_24305 [Aggregatilinea sp.]|uniref:hypothetical protein n=1 Tax=Aggregatilinea sp. TaxID=2806333 RepID=UPI002CABB156|nr:hypothetical protein [Aggregatilinea sp.]HML24799.1 hypothetical protein [Aggregatilinea sp.]
MDHWENFWKETWERTRARHEAWWNHEGFVLHVTAPADHPRLPVPSPKWLLQSGIDTDYPLTGNEPVSEEDAWLNPERRAALAELAMARTYYGAEAFPFFDTHIGPGSVGMFLGAVVEFADSTVWYHPCLEGPATDAPHYAFDPQNDWFLKHKALIEAGLARRDGRYLIGMPDLIENVDTLSALRGATTFMIDLLEEPEWVEEKVAEINQVFFDSFDALYDLIKDPWGGNAFSAFNIWGPGKTAKIQCDLGAMISPRMYKRFVIPALEEQANWLDYSMFHLDGTQAMVHLDSLLAIENLDAIEWTPQAGKPGGGDPCWWEMYHRILDAGKSVQAVYMTPPDVIPMLEEFGPKGLYMMVEARTEAEARALEEAVEAYR